MKRAAGILVALLATPLVARAEDATDTARRYFEAGKQAYESGQYAMAVTAFEEAVRMQPRPPILFSLAQAYRRQYFVDRDAAKLRRAVELYARYLEEVPSGGRREDAVQILTEIEPLLARLDAERRRGGQAPIASPSPLPEKTQIMVSSRTQGAFASIDGGTMSEVPVAQEVTPGKHTVRVSAPGYFAEEVVGEALAGRLAVIEVGLREMPAKIAVNAPAGASISIDGRLVASAPIGRPLEVPAGSRFLTVTDRGAYPFTRELVLDKGAEIAVEAELKTTTQRKLAWAFGIGGLAVGTGGTVTTVIALVADREAANIRRKIDNQEQLTPAEAERHNLLINRRNELARWSVGLLAVGAGGLATGALLWFLDEPRVELPALSPALMPSGGAGATLSGSF